MFKIYIVKKKVYYKTTKVNSKLSFLRRNLKGCLEKLRETAYFALVRSFLEYSATVWLPHQKYNSDKLERVQRSAARIVKGRYGMYESVTQMLEELTWIPLSKRRKNARLILFYKIINNLAMVPHTCLEKADGRTRKKRNLKFRHIWLHETPRRSISNHICERILLITEPEPEPEPGQYGRNKELKCSSCINQQLLHQQFQLQPQPTFTSQYG